MDDKHPDNDPNKAGNWSEHRHIRAALIHWLCVNRIASQCIDSRGIQVYGAKIPDALDLSYVVVPFPLVLVKCRVVDVMKLQAVKIPMLSLDGTRVHSIKGDSVDVNGGVFLRNGFYAEHEVRLHRARIGGGLDCSKGTFTNPAQESVAGSGRALTADGIVVGGGVSLIGIHAEGEVRLSRAQIQGDLDCSAGTIKNAPQERVQGTGSVLIEGTGTALNADGVSVKSGLFLRDSVITGQVRLARSQIGMDLDCSRSTLVGEVNAEGAEIGGALFWTGFTADPVRASLNLMNTSVGILADDMRSWPTPGNLKLNGFVYGRMSGRAPTDAQSRLDWLSRQTSFERQPYRQLAKVLRDDGNVAGAQQILFEMEHLRRKKEDRGPVDRAYSFLFRNTVGYGYYPAKFAASWLLGLAILGFVLFWGGFCAGSIVPTDKDAYLLFKSNHRELPAYYERFHASMFSLQNCFQPVNLGQTDRWQPDPGPSTGATAGWTHRVARSFLSPQFLRGYRWLQIILGWFFTAMVVAGMADIVRKD
jgi:hypothetical protein